MPFLIKGIHLLVSCSLKKDYSALDECYHFDLHLSTYNMFRTIQYSKGSCRVKKAVKDAVGKITLTLITMIYQLIFVDGKMMCKEANFSKIHTMVV